MSVPLLDVECLLMPVPVLYAALLVPGLYAESLPVPLVDVENLPVPGLYVESLPVLGFIQRVCLSVIGMKCLLRYDIKAIPCLKPVKACSMSVHK